MWAWSCYLVDMPDVDISIFYKPRQAQWPLRQPGHSFSICQDRTYAGPCVSVCLCICVYYRNNNAIGRRQRK